MVSVEDRFGGENTVAVFGFYRSGVAAPTVVDPFAFDRDGAAGSCWAADRYGEEIDLYHLDAEEAQSIADRHVDTIRSEWDEVCDLARLTLSQRRTLMGGPILNDYIFYAE